MRKAVVGGAKKEPILVSRRDGLYLKNIQAVGRGVFCLEDIKEGEVIEIAPLMVFKEDDVTAMRNTILADYWFSGRKLPRSVLLGAHAKNAEDVCMLPMGLASFCNHSADPNVDTVLMNEVHTAFYALTARRDIPAGTEICITYGPAWFVRRDIQEGRL